MLARALLSTALLVGAAEAADPPVTVTFDRLPQQAWLCSRHGPDWQLGRGPESIGGRAFASPFALTVAPGQVVKFRVKARATDRSAVTYATTGWPAGATLDAATGEFRWTAAGAPGERFAVDVTARAAADAQATTHLDVRVATELEQALWRAGLGGKAWPDCTARPAEQVIREVDLDGDGRLDALVLSAWTDPGDDHGHRFSRHELLLRGPKGDRVLDWELASPEGWLGDVEVARAPGGVALLVARQHACAGDGSVRFFAVRGGAVVSAGDFYPVEPADGGEGDGALEVKLLPDADGVVTAIQVTEYEKTRKIPWKNGGFDL
ncbi:MAG: putative Ig domain-containing protein [Myxococcales bacterium]|nr:putative Ig domain-containing protein [Myxococcales bacterium]